MTPVEYLALFSDSIIYLSILLIPLNMWNKDKKKLFLYGLALALNVALVYFLKVWFAVPRPVGSLIPIPPTPSFPSMHASLGLLPAGFFFHEKKYRIYLVVYGILISYSRVLLGVHYWGDILVGSIIGFLIPFAILKKSDFLTKKILGVKLKTK